MNTIGSFIFMSITFVTNSVSDLVSIDLKNHQREFQLLVTSTTLKFVQKFSKNFTGQLIISNLPGFMSEHS